MQSYQQRRFLEILSHLGHLFADVTVVRLHELTFRAGDKMAKTVVKNMVCIGGAALVGVASFATETKAQGFEGFYGGASYGANNGDATVTERVFNEDYAYSGNYGGRSAGLFAGYNVAVGDWIVGPELVWTERADANAEGSGPERLSDIIDLRVRGGRTFGNTLVYGALGYSRARLTSSGKFGSFTSNLSGASIGVGFEVNLARNVFVGGDVTRRNFRPTTGSSSSYDDGKHTTVTVRAGLRF
jgi:hypothetical protein